MQTRNLHWQLGNLPALCFLFEKSDIENLSDKNILINNLNYASVTGIGFPKKVQRS